MNERRLSDELPASRRLRLARLALTTAASLALTAANASTPSQYTIATLFDVPGLQSSHPLEINDRDEIVGNARFTSDDRVWGWRQDGNNLVFAHPLLALAGHAAPTMSGYMLLPYFPNGLALFQRTRVLFQGAVQAITNPVGSNGEAGVYGTDVNESGLAVGFVIDFNRVPAAPFAFEWRNGTTALLDRDDVSASWAGAVNDQAVIAGAVRETAGEMLKPVIWRGDERIALSPLAGIAHHVNNAGVVMGQFQPAINKAFLWKDGLIIDPCPSLPQCIGMHLNEAGQALVRADARSYVFDNGVLTDIGILARGRGTFAHTLIDNGTVVGYSSPDGSYADARAFVYAAGTLRDVNELLPPGSGWTRLIDAIGVNSSGRIVGIGIKDGVAKAFLMTPAP